MGSLIKKSRLDSRAARKGLAAKARHVVWKEDLALAEDSLDVRSSRDRIATSRGVGLGLYFAILPWLALMMVWMFFCAVPYLIVINTTVFTDYEHRYDDGYGVKVYDSFTLPSLTFAAIVDDKKDFGALQYLNTDLADTWRGPMKKGTFLTWIAMLDAGAVVVLSGAIVALFFAMDGWLRRLEGVSHEVADYSVLVSGLPPDTTATEIGRYFASRFSMDDSVDKVMDVVLVKDVSLILERCKKVHKHVTLRAFVAREIGAEQSSGGASSGGAGKGDKAAVPSATTAASTKGVTATAEPKEQQESGELRHKEQPEPSPPPQDPQAIKPNLASPFAEQGAAAAAAAADATSAGGAKKDGQATPDGALSGTLSGTIPAGAIASDTVPSEAALFDAEAEAALALALATAREEAAAAAAPAAGAAAAATGGAALTGPSTATASAEVDVEKGEPPKILRALSSRLAQRMGEAEEHIAAERAALKQDMQEGRFVTKAAFVTFNTERMRDTVIEAMPSGWWSAWLAREHLRFPHAGALHRIWVQPAAAPEDYRFENLAWRVRANMGIQFVTGLIMFVLVLVCAAFITWLSDRSNKATRDIKWDGGAVTAGIGPGLAQLASGSISTHHHLRRLMGAVQFNATQDKAAYNSFCSAALPGACTAYINGSRGRGSGLNITFGSQWSFPNTTTKLLYERPVRQELLQCSQDPLCELSYCLPCYCLGLSYANTDKASPAFLAHVKDTCSSFWTPYDLQRDGIKVAISFVIAAINAMLVFLLRMFKFNVEKHWTTTGTELSFAIWAYAVKLVNSVAVLLVVNCSSLSDLQTKAMAGEAGWVRSFILGGQYDDFSPEWYEAVGFSVMILMLINISGPFVRTAVEYGLKLVARAQLLLLHWGQLGSPEDFINAYRAPQFTLEQRAADILFNLTLALLFGSGMPLCYLIAAAYIGVTLLWDRLSLLGLRQPAQRYSKQLPRAIMQLLPVMVIVHCAFGIWMHTYFKAELAALDVVAAATGAINDQGVTEFSNNKTSRRVTQPNGIPLLICFVVLLVWAVFGRWIVWGSLKLVGRGCYRLASLFVTREERPVVTYEAALRSTRRATALRGARTYRLHHLTAYKEFLSGGAAGKLWAAVQGEARYTRLTTFRVLVDVEVPVGGTSGGGASAASVKTASAGGAPPAPSQPSASAGGASTVGGAARPTRIEQREVELFDVSVQPIEHVARVQLETPTASVGNPLRISGIVPAKDGPNSPAGGVPYVPSAQVEALAAAAVEQLAAGEAPRKRESLVVKRISMRRSRITCGSLGPGDDEGKSGSPSAAAAGGEVEEGEIVLSPGRGGEVLVQRVTASGSVNAVLPMPPTGRPSARALMMVGGGAAADGGRTSARALATVGSDAAGGEAGAAAAAAAAPGGEKDTLSRKELIAGVAGSEYGAGEDAGDDKKRSSDGLIKVFRLEVEAEAELVSAEELGLGAGGQSGEAGGEGQELVGVGSGVRTGARIGGAEQGDVSGEEAGAGVVDDGDVELEEQQAVGAAGADGK